MLAGIYQLALTYRKSIIETPVQCVKTILNFTIRTPEHDVNFDQINAGWAHSVRAIDRVKFWIIESVIPDCLILFEVFFFLTIHLGSLSISLSTSL